MSLDGTLGIYTEVDRKRAKVLGMELSPVTGIFFQLVRQFTALSFLETVHGSENLRFRRNLTFLQDESHVMERYGECRFIRPFNREELQKIRSVLPSEKILQRTIENMRESHICSRLQIKSTVKLFCEDFPHLEGLYYCEKIRRIDEFLEDVSHMDVPPFYNYSDLNMCTIKCEVMGDIHPWWVVGNRSIEEINGIPIEKARKKYEAQIAPIVKIRRRRRGPKDVIYTAYLMY